MTSAAAGADGKAAGKVRAGKEPLAHDRLGRTYQAFRWLGEAPSDGGTKENGGAP